MPAAHAPRFTWRRRDVAAFLVGATGLASCGDVEREARDQALRWFVGELRRAGYVEAGDGHFSVPPKPAAGLLLGDALEVQVRAVAVTRVVSAPATDTDQAESVRWRGQAYVAYELREQYYLEGRPRGWGEWQQHSGVVTLEKRADRWYATRIK